MLWEEFQNGINIEEQLFPSRSYPHCCIPNVAQYVNNIVEIPRNTQVLKDLDFYDDNNSSLWHTLVLAYREMLQEKQ